MSQKTTFERLNTKQAAKYLGLAEQSLHNRRFRRLPPSYIKIGRRILYDIKDLDLFLESCRVEISA